MISSRTILALSCLLPPVTVLSCLIGFSLDARWLLPLLASLPAWAGLALPLRAGRRGLAVTMVLWWAMWLAVSSVGLTLCWPERAGSVILNGVEYRDEMFQWILTGLGKESSPAQFIPQHLLHAGVFCLAAVVSGGALALVMGAALLDYMGFYVGELIARCAGSGHVARALLLAWNPWSVIRIVSFVILGVVLAEPLIGKLLGGSAPSGGRRWWILAALAGLLADMALKASLAPLWPGLLSGCLD
ncbi:MAG TPA: hypothetical protein VFG76_04200 [Candidatus Polarisedimenticolia bacterium]|nr:hypothetical protein [Candidatus Polarisedimenticolia bacterium]